MSEARSITNLIGNAVVTRVVTRWEGALDVGRARQILRGEEFRSVTVEQHEPLRQRACAESRLVQPCPGHERGDCHVLLCTRAGPVGQHLDSVQGGRGCHVQRLPARSAERHASNQRGNANRAEILPPWIDDLYPRAGGNV